MTAVAERAEAGSAAQPATIDDALTDRYLARLGFTGRPAPTLANLAELQESHVLTVPFENLDYHYGREIPMDERVVEKIAVENRGGGCYELNPSFHYLLLALGYDSRILAGRSYRGGVLGLPYMHLVLEVVVDGASYLVDTGFRRNSRRPLSMTDTGDQADPHGTYRLEPVAGARDEIDVYLDGEPQYRFDRRGATVADFGPTLWWWRSSPDSPFLQSIFCSLPTRDGRVTLTGDRLSVSAGGERTSRVLGSDDEVLTAYREHFGIELDALPPLNEHGGKREGIRLE